MKEEHSEGRREERKRKKHPCMKCINKGRGGGGGRHERRGMKEEGWERGRGGTQ
jgi:hypothetical protein